MSVTTKKLKRILVHPVEYLLFRVTLTILLRLPDKLAEALGRAIGSCAWAVLRIRRQVTIANLVQAFPGKNPGELEKIGRGCYRNLGAGFIEVFRMPVLTMEWMESRISIEGREILDKALEEGLGVINATFHFGNWELMGAYTARLGYPVEVIARSQTNASFNDYLNRMRRSNGMGLIEATKAHRKVMRSLQKGRIVTFLADQDAHRVGVFVDFLDQPASTPRGPALYAFKTGAPVVLSIMLPREAGRMEIHFEQVPRPQTREREEFITQMTQFYTDRLTYYIRRAPEHWFWPHRRWKTRPPCPPKS